MDNLRYLVVKPAYPQNKTQFSALNTPTGPLSMKKYEATWAGGTHTTSPWNTPAHAKGAHGSALTPSPCAPHVPQLLLASARQNRQRHHKRGSASVSLFNTDMPVVLLHDCGHNRQAQTRAPGLPGA